jgi:hypothetical protein
MGQIGLGLLVGVAVGSTMGYFVEHMGLWIGVGAATGIIIGLFLDKYHLYV